MPLADLLDRLPSPIAIPLHSYLEEPDPRQRLWALCDSVELLLRLLVFVGIADLARREGKPPQPLRARLRTLIERPTLGRWADMAEAVARTQATQSDSLVPESAPLVQHTLLPLLDGGPDRSTERTSLLALRNRLAHGGGVARALAEPLLAAWREPFEQAMEGLAWLGELALVVRGPDGYGCLRGPTPEASPYAPRNLAAVAEALALADAVAVVRGEAALPLWPLVLYGPPHNLSSDYPQEESVPQIYQRQEDIHLQYTPLGGTACHSQAGDAALARFQELFHVDREPSPARASRCAVRDFRDRIRSLADRLVGRTVELATLRGVLDATPEGVIWVAGTAGIGKSSLLARVAQDRLDQPPSNTWVLPYWFDAGDERCQRETFLRFAIERLRGWLRTPPPEDGEESPKPLQQLRELLQHLDGRRVLFVLDGLDEITGRDPHFARDVPLGLRLPGVTWLCAGRPEQGLPQLFRPEIAHHPFPDGLSPMREGDIRAMLLENLTGELRKRLISQDRERGEAVINPFVDNVAKAARGLPLYVRLAINDIWAGRYRMLDAGERLPPSLNAYHEEHLRRCAVSSLQQILTPMVALLAVVHEEPTADMLAALLRQRTLIPAGEAGLTLVRDGLAALESMVRRKRDEDGRVRYALHHHSLRQHVQDSPRTRQAVETAREFLGDAALQVKPDAAAHYLYRHGILHLLDVNRQQEAQRLLSCFSYLMARLRALPDPDAVLGLAIDWQAIRRQNGAVESDISLWEAFFREREHVLLRGDKKWPAYKILLQLAVEHVDRSPVTQQAEAWLKQGNCDWVWLRNPKRPYFIGSDHCLRTFEGHQGPVVGARKLPDKRILSWSDDGNLHIWSLESSKPQLILKGHEGRIIGATILESGQILSWSTDGTVRLWHKESGRSSIFPSEPRYSKLFAELLGDGKIISYSEEIYDGRFCGGDIYVWDAETQEIIYKENLRCWESFEDRLKSIRPYPLYEEFQQWKKEFLKSRKSVYLGYSLKLIRLTGNLALCWSDSNICLWDYRTNEKIAEINDFFVKIEGAINFNDGKILSWHDKELTIWNFSNPETRVYYEGHLQKISGTILIAEDQFLSWSEDGTLRLWKINKEIDNNCLSIGKAKIRYLSKHKSNQHSDFCTIIKLSNGILLSWDFYIQKKLIAWISENSYRTWSMDFDHNLKHEDHGQLTESDDNLIKDYKSLLGSTSIIELKPGVILSGSACQVEIFDFHQRKIIARINAPKYSSFEGALLLPNEKILIWYDDEYVDSTDYCAPRAYNYTVLAKLGDNCILKQSEERIEGAALLPDQNILSWFGEDLKIWDQDFNLIASYSFKDASREAPELLWKREIDLRKRFEKSMFGDHYAETSDKKIQLLSRQNPTYQADNFKALFLGGTDFNDIPRHLKITAIWNEIDAKIYDSILNENGTLVITSEDGQVLFLKLYHGNRQISLSDLDHLIASGG